MSCDGDRHGFDIVQYVLVIEVNHVPPLVAQVLLSSLIFFVLCVVVTAIKFDGEMVRVASEVENVRRLGMLSAKFQTTYLLGSQYAPKQRFGFRLPSSKLTCVCDGIAWH